jgi:hypothetical protein
LRLERDPEKWKPVPKDQAPLGPFTRILGDPQIAQIRRHLNRGGRDMPPFGPETEVPQCYVQSATGKKWGNRPNSLWIAED